MSYDMADYVTGYDTGYDTGGEAAGYDMKFTMRRTMIRKTKEGRYREEGGRKSQGSKG